MYKSTIIIYSEFDPATVELSTLAREAEEGSAICTSQKTEHIDISDEGTLPEDAASFFNLD